MTPAEYAKVKEVFSAAIELPEHDRDAYVQQQCVGQDEAIHEVLSLLRHHRDDTLLDQQVTAQSIVVAPPSKVVDPYLVLSDVWEDSRQILRRRLVIIASVMAALTALSTLRLLTYHYAEWGYGVRVLAITVSTMCAVILHRKRDLTLAQIRIAEFVVMANTGLLIIVIDVRLMLEAATANDEATLISVTNWQYFAWTLIIFIYGVFMPNTWQRAAAVLLPIAAIPSLLTEWVCFLDPLVAALLDEDRFGQPLPTPFIAAAIAIYAAHLIHGARLSAFQARRLAQYHIKRLIGEGGMGQVFEAEHLLLKRACAIKLIQPERSADDRAQLRFEREVRATAKLTHPNTIEIYDYGKTKDGVFFFAMELLPGMNLRDLVKSSGPLPPARAIHFLSDVCEALHEAHQAGLIHRDVKPSNIFASQRGGIYDFTKLLDFGVVREMEVDPSLSITSAMVAGTPAFMSPEQITEPAQIDARSDLYAVGAVAYYLLTGRPPFLGDSPVQVMLAQVNQVPEFPSTYEPGIPADLEMVVMRCLVKDVDDRYSDAAQLQSALQACSCAGTWTREDAADWWNGRVVI